MYVTLELLRTFSIVVLSTAMTPNGNSCAPFVFQLFSSTQNEDLLSAIPSLRSYGSPLP